MRGRRTVWCAAIFGLSAVTTAVMNDRAEGAGYAVYEQSVKQLGNAYAGGAASAEDASTVFYNPAGMSRLPGSQVVAGMHVIFPSTRFGNEGSTDLTGQPLSGGFGGNAGTLLAIPNLYFSRQLNDRVHLGLGVFSPFGLSTEYDGGWVGRYHAVKSDLVSLNLNPAVAFAVTDKLSLGAGLNGQYMKAELTNAIDFGSIFGLLGAPGFAPQQNDGFVTFKGDSWSWGYNLGLLYQFTERTRGGVAYRSAISHTIKGDADFYGVPSFNPTGRFIDTGIRADATTPNTVSVSLWHGLTGDCAAMADITWTNWSKLVDLRIRFDSPAESDAVTIFNWKDTFRYSVGAVYTPGAWTIRAGVAYDESPVPGAERGTPRIPDEDRIWVAGGLGYRISDSVSFDFGYAHLFVKDAGIRKSAAGEDRLTGALTGASEGNVDIASVEVTWNF